MYIYIYIYIYAECDGTNNPQLPAQRKQLKFSIVFYCYSLAAVLLCGAAECSTILKRFFSGRKSNKVYKLFFEFICYFTEKKKKKTKHNIASASNNMLCIHTYIYLCLAATGPTTIKTPGSSARFIMSFYKFVTLFRNLQHAHLCVCFLSPASFSVRISEQKYIRSHRRVVWSKIHKTKFLR